MPLLPFAILCAVGLLLTAVFGAMHWVMAVEEGLIWGVITLIPVVALAFTFQFWRRNWVRRSFFGGVISFTLAIAGFVGVVFKIPGLTEQFQAYRRGDYNKVLSQGKVLKQGKGLKQGNVTGLSNLIQDSDQASSDHDHFSDGIIYAELATELTQTAHNRSDWEQVATHWSYAVDMMSAVPENHPKFDTARAKIKEYQRKRFTITRQHLRY